MTLLSIPPPIRLAMSLADAAQLRALLSDVRDSDRQVALHDVLWLRTVLVEQWRRTPRGDRVSFGRRGDAILGRLTAVAAQAGSVRSPEYGEKR